MRTTITNRPPWVATLATVLVVILSLLASNVSAQQRRPEDSTERILNRAEHGTLTVADVTLLANRQVKQSVPLLRQQFPKTNDELLKQALAAALIRLGDRTATYWDYLADKARPLVESDQPFPGEFDHQGKAIKGEFSADFKKWTQVHNTKPEVAVDQMFHALATFQLLAAAGDPRSREVLTKALSSPNYFVQMVGARGLARLQDKKAIPLIIEACEKAPSDVKTALAEPLVFLDDPLAQSAAVKFIQDPQTLEVFRRLSREKGLEGLF